MRKPMPPLRSLVAFEAAVRHASFKQAAEEMCITPGAVSQQVQKLEQWLGYQVFIREVRQLKITTQGMSYYSRIAPALEQISTASTAFQEKQSNTVCLSLSQTLAAKWLGPRLENFVSRHPNIEVHINASNSPVNFNEEPVDLAIRHFNGKDPSLNAQLVYDDQVRLFCTPKYRELTKLKHPNQLIRTTLLIASLYPFWDDWFTAFTSIDAQERKKITALHFDQTLLAIDAAKRSQGVILSNALLVQDELKQGTLIEPFDRRLPLEKSYYLVHPNNLPLSNTGCILKDWLLEKFSTSDANNGI